MNVVSFLGKHTYPLFSTGDEGDGMYTKASATADEISAMLDAIMDPYRGQTFKVITILLYLYHTP
jgi:hypothetical protein